jgi:hypothetical protein
MNYRSNNDEDTQEVTPEDVRDFLESELSPEAFAKIQQMLQAMFNQKQDNGEQDNGPEPGSATGFIGEFDQSQDEPPPFKGRPRPGGAMDAAYRRRFPGAGVRVFASDEAAPRCAQDSNNALDALRGFRAGLHAFALNYPGALRGRGPKSPWARQARIAQDQRPVSAAAEASYAARFGRVRHV